MKPAVYVLWLPRTCRLPADLLSQVNPISRLVYIERVLQTDADLMCAMSVASKHPRLSERNHQPRQECIPLVRLRTCGR